MIHSSSFRSPENERISSQSFQLLAKESLLCTPSNSCQHQHRRRHRHRSSLSFASPSTTKNTTTTMYYYHWSLFVILLATHCLSTTFACTEVYDNYDLLKTALDEGQTVGNAILCPFTIRGDACPPADEEPYVVTAPFLLIFCAAFGGGAGDACVIDCPHTHFDIQPAASLTLDTVTLSGAVNGSTIVREFATFTASYSVYQNNTAAATGGGAIRVEPNAVLILEYTDFDDNVAPEGGALYSEGDIFVTGGTFAGNQATMGRGGAIYASGLTTSVSLATFRSNRAAQAGPALYSTQFVSGGGNEACDNRNFAGEVCDGVDLGTGGCEAFGRQCTVAPTEAPTNSPTKSPTSSPTDTPTSSPTSEPTRLPTNQPTSIPTYNAPTTKPSATPSISPTQSPTSSHEPSGLPTPVPSVSPTDRPTTLDPTTIPSSSPTSSTPTSEPTMQPTSLSPTASPTTFPTTIAPTATPTTRPTTNPTTTSPTTSIPTSEPTDVPTPKATLRPTRKRHSDEP